MNTFYTYNHLYLIKLLSVLDGFTKKLLFPVRDFLTPQKRRKGFNKRLPTP